MIHPKNKTGGDGKVNEALKEILEEDPVYANDEDVLKKLSGLK